MKESDISYGSQEEVKKPDSKSPSEFMCKSKFNTEEKPNQRRNTYEGSSEEDNRKIWNKENESYAQSPAHKLKHKLTGSVSSISNGMMNYNTS